MKRIAVIGSGISGMAAAYYLSGEYEVSLFEKDNRIGGHTHTVMVDSSRGALPVDTGFIVHNDRTYPNLIRLFAELGVETQPSDMSFSVTCPRTGFEYSSRGLSGYFAQRANIFRWRHISLLLEILRFNREAPKLLERPDPEDITLAEYLQESRYSPAFKERYLLPMASAIWSTSLEDIESFPAVTLIRFFQNHGMLGIYTRPQWKVLRGGSHSYIPPLTAPYKERIYVGVSIQSVIRKTQGVTIKFSDDPGKDFDQVVFACHGDQVLPLLEKPTDTERDVLGDFRTSSNETCLHSDSSLLPVRATARASWNYNLGLAARKGVTLTYHMNRLQSLGTPEDYCVTLNGTDAIDPGKILRTMNYHHPLYTREAIGAQSRWEEISGRNGTHYCGAYWFYGFHEDGLKSALRVARAMGVEC